MDYLEFTIGIAAAFLCTVSFIPQVIKVLKTKHTKDLSLLAFSVLCLGVFLWFIYGFLIGKTPVILANGIVFILVIIIIIAKIKYG
ncbi:TPA: hypothetical protein DCX16_05125 [bacterium]|nr:hypothetical protein [bacterium]